MKKDQNQTSGQQLSPEQIEQYRRDGFLAPVDFCSPEEAAVLRSNLETSEQIQNKAFDGLQRLKANLLFVWIDQLIRDERILNPVRALIGPDILCWGTHMFVKEPGPVFLSWHQDHIYWGLDNLNILTVWVALSPSVLESGCVEVWPGSHRQTWAHTERPDKNNLLTRGQRIDYPIEDSEAVAMQLQPGQMSIHNVRLAHRSGANRSSYRRMGVAIRYMPTSTRQTLTEWDSATLVSGEDHYGYFELEPHPTRDLDPVTVAYHERTANNQINNLFGGAKRFH